MEIGISTACFGLKRETEAAVKTVKELGADCAEVHLRTFYEYRPEFAKAIAPDICGFEVRSVSVSPCNFERQLFSASRRIRGDGFYWLDQILRSAQLLKAGGYIFRGDCRNGDFDGDFDALSAYMRGVTEFCSRYGVKACLENSRFGLYDRPSVFGELKTRCPELCGAFSIKEARASGYPYQMYLRDMRGAISCVKLSDIGADGRVCLPGEGITDFSEFFKRLKDDGFDGDAVIDADGDGSRLKRSLEFVRETAAKAH